MPGLEGASINIHPSNVCASLFVGAGCRLINNVQSRSASQAQTMNETTKRPRLGGSLFLGVSNPLLPSGSLEGLVGRTLTRFLNPSTWPHILLSIVSPTSYKILCLLDHFFSKVLAPSLGPPGGDFFVHCKRPQLTWKPEMQVQNI